VNPSCQESTSSVAKFGRHAALVSILLAGLVLRVHHLGAKSVWLDEAVSATLATYPFETFFRSIREHELNMSLYFGLLRPWLAVGDSESWLRLPSVMFGLLAVIALYRLADRLFGRRVALCAALLLAVHPFSVQYSQEARSYTLLMWLTIEATIAYFDLRASPGRAVAWLRYVGLCILACYAHFFFLLSWFVQALWLPWPRILREGRSQLLAHFAIAAGASPILWRVGFSQADNIGWIPRLSAQSWLEEMLQVYGDRWLTLGYLGAAAVVVLDAVRERPSPSAIASPRKALWFIAAWWVVPLLLATVLSLRTPILIARYLIASVAPLVLLVSVGIVRAFSRVGWQRASAVLLGALLCVQSLRRVAVYYRERQAADGNDWRSATRSLLTRAMPGDCIFAYPTATFALAYSARREAVEHGLPSLPRVAYPFPRLPGEPNLPPITRDNVARQSLSCERVWLVLNIVHEPDSVLARLRAYLGELYASHEARRIGSGWGVIDLEVFAEPAASAPSEQL
jgi:mannosyltransferase